MKVVLATPLYPPDIGAPAPYAKELARRLAGAHAVTVVAYGRIPEAVDGVETIMVDKRQPLPFRIVLYMRALYSVARRADIIYAENGASVELPLSVIAVLTGKPYVMHVGDRAARASEARSGIRGFIARYARARAKRVIEDVPLEKPEILPLDEPPHEAIRAWEHSWDTHVAHLAPFLSSLS